MQINRNILAYSIILTNACFLGCSHCFLRLNGGNSRYFNAEMKAVKSNIDMESPKTYKFRIYPTEDQKRFFGQHFGSCRWIYNHFLALRQDAYKQGKRLYYKDCQAMLPILKKKFPWLRDINSQSLQVSLQNLEKAYRRFFKKLGKYPRFKKKHNRQAFTVPQHFTLTDGLLFIPKLKTPIKVKIHRQMTGDSNMLTVIKEPSGKYYISVISEEYIQPMPELNTTIGIDLGLTHFATLSTGEKIEHPKYLKQSEKRLAKLQRRLSGKQKGSNNRTKARMLVARTHEKIANQRKDFLHKLSYRLISENQAISLEDLNVKGMVRNRHLAKAISDSGWSEFTRQVRYKADWYGRTTKQIPRFYPSSKECNICHFVNTDLKLSQRIWTCPNCGTVHNRDDNASKTIDIVGQDMPEVTPVERLASVTPILSMKQVSSLKQEAHRLSCRDARELIPVSMSQNTKNKHKAMEVKTVRKFIDRVMETHKDLTFNWGGGDPLILGKKYMKDIVSLKCFSDKNTRNTLYSTFLVDFDAEWKEILNSFDSLMFSLDSYRIKEKGFDLNKVMSNLANLNVPRDVSYTPSKEDNEDTIERFYLIARDICAEVFHIGFLYDDIELISPEAYNRAIDKVFSLQAKHGKPICGFTPAKDNIYHSVGWRAYDCFTKCRYVCDDEITSCYILKSKGFDVPSIKIDDFIEGRADIVSMNDSFISSFFLSGRTDECYECDYFSLCMGGCPYFVSRSSNINIDAYCSVYKKILKSYVGVAA